MRHAASAAAASPPSSCPTLLCSRARSALVRPAGVTRFGRRFLARTEPLGGRMTCMMPPLAPVLALPTPAGRSMRSHDLAHLSDEALVALVARWDESALAELYDRVGRIAYGLAYRILRDEALAEDAVQDGFLGLWRSAGSFSPSGRRRAPGSSRSSTGARSTSSAARSGGAPSRSKAGPRLPDGLRGGGGVAAASSASASRRRSRALPDAQREAIELAYYGGFTQSELAERLGEPLGTIKSRMFAGLSRLRELLDDGADGRIMESGRSRADRGLRARRARPGRARAYEEHLAACERCREELAAFWDVTGALAHAAPAPSPAGAARADPRAGPQRAARTSSRSSRAGAAARHRPSVAAVAAAAAIGLGIWALSLSRQRPRRRPRAPSLSSPIRAQTVAEREGEAGPRRRRRRRGRAGARRAAPAPERQGRTRSGCSRAGRRSRRASSTCARCRACRSSGRFRGGWSRSRVEPDGGVDAPTGARRLHRARRSSRSGSSSTQSVTDAFRLPPYTRSHERAHARASAPVRIR